MATIGNITVGVIANTQKAVRNMRKFRTEVRATSQQAKRSVAPVSGFTTALRGIGAGIVIAGLYKARAAIQRMIADIDKLSKMRDRLGFTAESLTGLQHVAELSGVSFEMVGMASQRMTRRVAEAAQGTGEAVNALQELNLEAKSLARLSPDQQLLRIADSMAGVANQGDKVRLAMKLFDTEGVKMLNVMKGGSVAIREALQEAERFSITMNDKVLDSFTNLGDELNKQGKMWLSPFRALRNYIGENLLPAINEVLKGVNLAGSNRLEGVSAAQLGAMAQRQNQQRDLFRTERPGDFGGEAAGVAFRNAQAVKHSQDALFREEQDILRRKREREKLNDKVAEAQKKLQDDWKKQQDIAKKTEEQRKASIETIRIQFEQGFQLKQDISRITALQATGGISAAVATAAIRDAVQRDSDQFTKAGEGGDRINNLLERGSSEAFTALRANTRSKADTLLQKQLDESMKQTDLLRDLKEQKPATEALTP